MKTKIAQLFMVLLFFQEMYAFSYQVKQSLSFHVPFLFKSWSLFLLASVVRFWDNILCILPYQKGDTILI